MINNVKRINIGYHRIKQTILHVKDDLLKNFNSLEKKLMKCIQKLTNARKLDAGIQVEKIRKDILVIVNSLKTTNLNESIYLANEKKEIQEKKKLKGIILFLEVIIMQVNYLLDMASELENKLIGDDIKHDNLYSPLISEMKHKSEILLSIFKQWDNNIRKTLGNHVKQTLEQFLKEFFTDEDVKKIMRMWGRKNYDKLEKQDLKNSDYIAMSIPNNLIFNLDNVITNKDPLNGPVDPKIVKSNILTTRKKQESNKNTSSNILTKIANDNVTSLKPDRKHYKTKIIETNLENLMIETFGITQNHEKIQEYVLKISEEIQEKENKPIIPLAKIYHDIILSHPEWHLTPKRLLKVMKSLEKSGMIAKIEKLPTGYYMIHVIPQEIASDTIKILDLGSKKKIMTKNEIMRMLGWNEHRVNSTLNFLSKNSLVKKVDSYVNGTQYYF
ncbi:MAG: hypothetical protein ACTSVI_14725 [Promethearchaeota archaeon]